MGRVSVHGSEIAFQVNGSGPTVVLVHGIRAHAGWWEQVSDRLCDSWRVVTFDLSGHGRSEERPRYSAEIWASEVVGIMDSLGTSEAPLVGHSLGGLVSLVTAAIHADRVSQVVLVDTPLRMPTVASADAPRGTPPSKRKYYARRDEAVAAFRLLPSQPQPSCETMEALATHALKRTTRGWTWAFDPNVLQRFTDRQMFEYAQRVHCPVAVVYGEKSSLTGAESARATKRILGSPVSIASIPNSYHHVPIDQPARLSYELANLLTRQGD